MSPNLITPCGSKLKGRIGMLMGGSLCRRCGGRSHPSPRKAATHHISLGVSMEMLKIRSDARLDDAGYCCAKLQQ